MDTFPEQKYTVGFIFDKKLRQVLLAHKEKPDWQKGKINGVGGKYEPGESPEACISRETKEETDLDIAEEDWTYVGTIHQNTGDVDVLAARYMGKSSDARSADHERVEWFDTEKLPDNVISNLRWLIPLSLRKLKKEFQSFSIQY